MVTEELKRHLDGNGAGSGEPENKNSAGLIHLIYDYPRDIGPAFYPEKGTITSFKEGGLIGHVYFGTGTIVQMVGDNFLLVNFGNHGFHTVGRSEVQPV